MHRNGGRISVPANAAAKLVRQIARRIDLPQAAAAARWISAACPRQSRPAGEAVERGAVAPAAMGATVQKERMDGPG
jgi:hypothetical protein